MHAALVTLVVYAYSSFTAPWGAGPPLVKIFEKQCDCQVVLVNGGDGGALVSRLKLEGNKTGADVVLGIDETLLAKIKNDLNWKTDFRAFDHSPYAFIYDSTKIKDPPTSLDGLLEPRWKGQILLEDPRLSTTGLGFLLWVIKEKGEGAWDYLAKLKTQVKIISPSWDLAYGLFKKGQGDLVFSYLTSPAYHIQEEGTDKFKAAIFPDGHYEQTEYLCVVPISKRQDLAKKFVQFMLSKNAQEEIPKKNFMYPVNAEAKLTEAFRQLQKVKVLSPLTPEQQSHLNLWLKKWLETFS